MFVVATFDYSFYLELAITDLEKRGIPRENIGGIPLDKRVEERKTLDSIHRADGFSAFDGAAVLGTIFMLLGAIYGFILSWGPIIWGLIGLFTGALLGFVLDNSFSKLHHSKGKKKTGEKSSEIVILLKCEEQHYEMVKKILWDNQALGVGVFKINDLISVN
ncbi:MAG: hypothetical protein PHO01_04735 [Desulfotomaculaceae bacterium]|nr:hypothetical protein [Desulfotomaculaceae bacterium]